MKIFYAIRAVKIYSGDIVIIEYTPKDYSNTDGNADVVYGSSILWKRVLYFGILKILTIFLLI